MYSVVVDFIARNGKFIRPANEVITVSNKVQETLRGVAKASIASGIGIVTSYGLASRGTLSFDRNLRNTNSLIRLTHKEYQRLGDSLLDLATEVPESATSLAQGAYNIVSSGFSNLTDINELLEQSSKAAVAGITDTDTSAKAIVTTLNAYNLTAAHSGRVSDILFQAVNRGQLTFEQLAINLGDFIGVARASGASLEETFAAYANVTIATGQAHRAATSIQAIYRSLLNPTEELAIVTESLGFETTKAAIQEQGLEKFLRQVTNAVGNNEQALFKLFGTVEAVSGVLALQAFSEEKAAENLSYFTDQAKIAGVTEETFAEQSKAVANGLEQAKTAAGVLGIEFGSVLLPVLDAASDTAIFLVRTFRDLPQPVQEFIHVMGLASGIILALAGVTALFYGKLKLVQLAFGFLTRHGIIGWMNSYIQSTTLGAAATTYLGNRVVILRSQMAGMVLTSFKAAGALGLVALGASQLGEAMHPHKVREMRQALDEFANSQAFTGQLEKAFGNVEGLAKAIDRVYDLSRGEVLKSFLNPFGKTDDPFKLSPASRAIDDLDEALVQLVQNGQAEQAAQMFEHLSESLQEQGVNVDQINEAFNDYRGAVDDAAFAGRGAAASQYDLSTAGGALDESIASTINEVSAAEKAFRNLTEAQESFALSIAGPAGSLDPIFASIIERRRTEFDETRQTAKGRSPEERAHDIAQATLGIVRAQYRLNDAEREYARLLQEGNAQEVSEAEDRLADARYGVRAATRRLQDAEKALEEARRGPTARDLRELEMGLERARDQQVEATEQLTYAENKLAAAQDHGTPEELAESERELREARRQVEEAAWGVEDAEKALVEARQGPKIEEIERAEYDLELARRDVETATQDVGQAEKDLADARVGEEYATALRDAEISLREAILGVQGAHLSLAQAQKDEGSEGHSRFRDEQEKTKVSLGEMMTELENQISAYENWSDNILTIAQRFGPAVAAVLAKMGMDGANIVNELANATGSDAQRMANDLEKWAVLGTEALNKAVVQNLGAAKDNAKELTRQQVEAVAEELGIGYEKAVEILQKYGYSLQQTAQLEFRINPASGLPEAYIPGQGFVNINYYRGGGFYPGEETHTAQIAPAGAWRVFAEEETGGEAYIPLGANKRARSMQILGRVAQMFGYDLLPLAEGGVFGPPPSMESLMGMGIVSTMVPPLHRAMTSMFENVLRSISMDGSSIVSVGRMFQNMGYAVSEHPEFGGVRGRHVDDSYHYRNRAIDVNWYPAAQEFEKLDWLSTWIRQHLDYVELLWQVAGHFNHLHLAMANGGIVSFDRGGYLEPGLTMAYNGTGRPEPVGYGMYGDSYTLNFEVITHMTADADANKVTSMVGDEIRKQLGDFRKDLNRRVVARVGRHR